MNRLPPPLFDLIQGGMSDEDVQLIFDYLIEAEECGARFVNVYLLPEIRFGLFRSSAAADDQLGLWKERVKSPVLALANSGDTWEARAPRDRALNPA
jgi:hypothetical protein